MPHPKMISYFTNELGRLVKIELERGDGCALTIRMTGPDSTVENEITIMEARMLCALLRFTIDEEDEKRDRTH